MPINSPPLSFRYIPTLSEVMKHRFKKITPIADIAHIETLCRLLEALIVPSNIPADGPKGTSRYDIRKIVGFLDPLPLYSFGTD